MHSIHVIIFMTKHPPFLLGAGDEEDDDVVSSVLTNTMYVY